MGDIRWTILMVALEDKAAKGFFESMGIFWSVMSFVRHDTDVVVKIGAGVTEGVGLLVAIGVIDMDGFKVAVKVTRMVVLVVDGDSAFDDGPKVLFGRRVTAGILGGTVT
jgi:hypothetical protein